MKLHELKPAEGSKKAPKRIGRGTGSGTGRNAGKGEKGQNARSGGGVRPGFEGGQMPLYRRVPKRGFTNIFAKKNLVSVAMVGTTVPHQVNGKFGTANVLIMPAKEGTGVLAGGPARAVLELAGLKDVRAKSLGSNNPNNMVSATINGLANLRTAEDIAKLRGKSVEEILG